MFRWLRKFFYSDDPVVKLVSALSEPEAEMWCELLLNEGVATMSKNVGSGVGHAEGRATMFTRDYDLFVKQSDLERARAILDSLEEPEEEDAYPEWG